MLVSPARRRFGLDSTGRGGAPAALDVVRSGCSLEDKNSNLAASARTHPLDLFVGIECAESRLRSDLKWHTLVASSRIELFSELLYYFDRFV